MPLVNRSKTSEGLTRSGVDSTFYAQRGTFHRRENAQRQHENANLDAMDILNCKIFS